MKRFRAALKNKSNWPSLITLVLILACSVFSFWDTRFSEQARSMAFALVAVEFFIMLVVHLEEVKGAIGEIKNGGSKGMRFTKQRDGQTGELIAEAKEELFFVGWSLSRLTPYRMHNVSDKIRIRLLTLDLSDENACNSCVTAFGRPPELASLNRFDCFCSKENFALKTVKFPISIHVAARDMKTVDGRIQIAFLEFGKTGYETPIIELSPADTELYEFYKNQIELLWAQGTPWTPPTKAGTP